MRGETKQKLLGIFIGLLFIGVLSWLIVLTLKESPDANDAIWGYTVGKFNYTSLLDTYTTSNITEIVQNYSDRDTMIKNIMVNDVTFNAVWLFNWCNATDSFNGLKATIKFTPSDTAFNNTIHCVFSLMNKVVNPTVVTNFTGQIEDIYGKTRYAHINNANTDNAISFTNMDKLDMYFYAHSDGDISGDFEITMHLY